MKPINLFVDGMQHLAQKLPNWARVLVALWIFMMIPVMFGWISVPIENNWLRAVVLAPAGLIVLFAIAQIIASSISWITWPFRKAAALMRKEH